MSCYFMSSIVPAMMSSVPIPSPVSQKDLGAISQILRMGVNAALSSLT